METFETSDNATPILRTKERCVDLVYSPDDGGYYFHDYDLVGGTDRVSVRTWPRRHDAERDWRIGNIAWE